MHIQEAERHCRDCCTLCAGIFKQGCMGNGMICFDISVLRPFAPFLRNKSLSIYTLYIFLPFLLFF